jgi:hypothetical protein
MGASDTSGRGGALRVFDSQHDHRGLRAFGAAAVGVFDVHVGIPNDLQQRRQGSWRVRDRRHDHIALGDLMMVLAQDRRAVHVVIDHQAQLTTGVERHRLHVDTFI